MVILLYAPTSLGTIVTSDGVGDGPVMGHVVHTRNDNLRLLVLMNGTYPNESLINSIVVPSPLVK